MRECSAWPADVYDHGIVAHTPLFSQPLWKVSVRPCGAHKDESDINVNPMEFKYPVILLDMYINTKEEGAK